MAELRPYQHEAATFMADVGLALLADAPRVGKTASAIRAIQLRECQRVLWVTTGSARADHAKAWGTFAPEYLRNVIFSGKDHIVHADVDLCVTIISYDLARRRRAELNKVHFDAVVLDEVHKLKGRENKVTQALLGPGSLTDGVTTVFALSGTPAPNNFAELYPLLAGVFPDSIRSAKTGNPVAYWTFASRFCKLLDNGFGVQIVGNKNADELARRMAPFTMRRTLADIAPQLPPLQSSVLPLGDKADVARLKEIEIDSRLRALSDRLEAAPDDETRTFILHSATAHLDKSLPRLTGLAKVPSILDWILEEDREKLVIFAWHHEVLDALEKTLGFSSVRVDGGTTGVRRGQLVERFMTDPKCQFFLGQIQAAGEAIDLSISDEILFAESSWVPGHNQQAAMRIVNVNRPRPAFARFATIPGSLDERIQGVASRKLADLQKLWGK